MDKYADGSRVLWEYNQPVELPDGEYYNGGQRIHLTSSLDQLTCKRCRKHYGPLVHDMERSDD